MQVWIERYLQIFFLGFFNISLFSSRSFFTTSRYGEGTRAMQNSSWLQIHIYLTGFWTTQLNSAAFHNSVTSRIWKNKYFQNQSLFVVNSCFIKSIQFRYKFSIVLVILCTQPSFPKIKTYAQQQLFKATVRIYSSITN